MEVLFTINQPVADAKSIQDLSTALKNASCSISRWGARHVFYYQPGNGKALSISYRDIFYKFIEICEEPIKVCQKDKINALKDKIKDLGQMPEVSIWSLGLMKYILFKIRQIVNIVFGLERDCLLDRAVDRAAATKIQAVYRGYKVRHRRIQMLNRAAATKIQAIYRGYKVRYRRIQILEKISGIFKKIVANHFFLESEWNQLSLNEQRALRKKIAQNFHIPEVRKAADFLDRAAVTKIQAVYRGYEVRHPRIKILEKIDRIFKEIVENRFFLESEWNQFPPNEQHALGKKMAQNFDIPEVRKAAAFLYRLLGDNAASVEKIEKQLKKEHNRVVFFHATKEKSIMKILISGNIREDKNSESLPGVWFSTHKPARCFGPWILGFGREIESTQTAKTAMQDVGGNSFWVGFAQPVSTGKKTLRCIMYRPPLKEDRATSERKCTELKARIKNELGRIIEVYLYKEKETNIANGCVLKDWSGLKTEPVDNPLLLDRYLLAQV